MVKNRYQCPTCQAGPFKWNKLLSHCNESGHPIPQGASRSDCITNAAAKAVLKESGHPKPEGTERRSSCLTNAAAKAKSFSYRCPTCQAGPAQWAILKVHFKLSGHPCPQKAKNCRVEEPPDPTQWSQELKDAAANRGKQGMSYRCPTCQAGPAKWSILAAHFKKTGHPQPQGLEGQLSCRVNEPEDMSKWDQDLKDLLVEVKLETARELQARREAKKGKRKAQMTLGKDAKKARAVAERGEAADQVLASALRERGEMSVKSLADLVKWGNLLSHGLGGLRAYIADRPHLFRIDGQAMVSLKNPSVSFNDSNASCGHDNVRCAITDIQPTDVGCSAVEIRSDGTDEDSCSCYEPDSSSEELDELPLASYMLRKKGADTLPTSEYAHPALAPAPALPAPAPPAPAPPAPVPPAPAPPAPAHPAPAHPAPAHAPAHVPALAPAGTKSREAELRSWLLSLDDGKGSLLQYEEAIVTEFDGDLVQVCAAWQGNIEGKSLLDSVDPEFFVAIGVRRTGHKFLFARGMASTGSKFNDP